MAITQDLLKELFDYRDGNLYWGMSKSQRVKIGDLAGTVMNTGYRSVGINGKRYLVHRLIFLWYHGYLPQFLDHIDGNPSNNDINNLRESTSQENNRNVKKHKSMNGKSTSSRFKGVYWDKASKKYLARITIDGKLKHLGRYDSDSEIEAALAYDRAAIKRDGKFALTNAMLFPEIFKTKE